MRNTGQARQLEQMVAAMQDQGQSDWFGKCQSLRLRHGELEQQVAENKFKYDEANQMAMDNFAKMEEAQKGRAQA